MTDLRKSAIRGIFGMCLLSVAATSAPLVAQAQDAAAPGAAPAAAPATAGRPVARRAARPAAGQYFIEFRSRYAQSYGHTFAAFGRLNGRGEIVQREIAGLHPFTESSIPWMIGHIVPVIAETGPSDGDLEDKYISARYRVVLTEDQYAKVVAKIRHMQRTSPLWSATLYNCNAFVGDIARYMGLRADVSSMLMPANYINNLKAINKGQSTIPVGSI